MLGDEPFALLITWTCYGQWLPGDRRGYVSNTLTEDGYRAKRNVVGTAYDRDDLTTYQRARQLQKQTTVWLTVAQARVVAEAMIGAAVDREWLILRGALMANHVHVVIAACPDDGPAVRRVLKGVSQAALAGRRSGRELGGRAAGVIAISMGIKRSRRQSNTLRSRSARLCIS